MKDQYIACHIPAILDVASKTVLPYMKDEDRHKYVYEQGLLALQNRELNVCFDNPQSE